MRFRSAAVAALAMLLVPAFAPPASAADALTGKMAMFDYLLSGPWSCTTKVPAMNGKPAHTDRSTVRFDVAPDNVLHDHVSSTDYAGDDYYAFDAKSNLYWNGSLGSDGTHGYASSPDGNAYTGFTWAGKTPTKIATTYTKVNATTVKSHVVLSAAGHQTVIESACTR